LWLSGGRETEKHHVMKEWPSRKNFIRGKFLKLLHKSSEDIRHWSSEFPNTTDAMFKQQIFVGQKLNIIKSMFDETFERIIYSTELPAWKFLNLLVRGFLATKGEKLFRNHKRSAAEITVVKIPVVTENPLLTLTHRLLSSKPTSRWGGKG